MNWVWLSKWIYSCEIRKVIYLPNRIQIHLPNRIQIQILNQMEITTRLAENGCWKNTSNSHYNPRECSFSIHWFHTDSRNTPVFRSDLSPQSETVCSWGCETTYIYIVSYDLPWSPRLVNSPTPLQRILQALYRLNNLCRHLGILCLKIISFRCTSTTCKNQLKYRRWLGWLLTIDDGFDVIRGCSTAIEHVFRFVARGHNLHMERKGYVDSLGDK